ncbi:MAG: peptide chain release factor 2 [Planctomycetota bacterium]|nr:peptide chain release factor 2 [Planctomycetota bacterium]
MSSELLKKLDGILARLATLRDSLDVPGKLTEKAKLEEKMGSPDFWENQETAQKTIDHLKVVRAATEPCLQMTRAAEDTRTLVEMAAEADDAASMQEALSDLAKLEKQLEHFELQTTFSGKDDANDVFFGVYAGTGGTDACDWAQMLLRMYTKWFDSHGYGYTLIDDLAGEEAGIRRATLSVKGPYAYGYLRAELGVHRLVRISPYDANKKRHTSFAAVDAVPEHEEEDIPIKTDDLRVDTYRAGGAGGQHVNVTDSAVRITHIPTGVVVQCQNERSQHANRRVAMRLLKARLHLLKERERETEVQRLYSEKGDIAWGSQIRSYVLHPYTLVKDHRTGVETGKVDSVLDGDLDMFIDAYLRQAATSRAKPR